MKFFKDTISNSDLDTIEISEELSTFFNDVTSTLTENQYLLSGKIIKGKQLGRTIGFPTANIKIEENYKLIPKNGVYIVKSIIQEKTVFGIMNIGLNPTVNGEDLSIEVHFLDFDIAIYNTEITVSVIDRIRDEQKFSSIDLLKAQIQKDKNYAISYIEKTV